MAAVVLTSTGWRWGIVGDSITYDAKEELAARGAVVLAFGGVNLQTGRQGIRQLATSRPRPRSVVVALGLMDVSLRATPLQLQQRIRRIMRDDLVGVPCPVWVDLTTLPTIHPNWPARAAQFNSILGDLAAEYGVHVAPWSTVTPLHPNWFRSDGIHLNRRGQNGYAGFVAGQVQRFCG